MIEVDGIVKIHKYTYALSSEALEILFQELKGKCYDIGDLSTDYGKRFNGGEPRPSRKVSEECGHIMWHAIPPKDSALELYNIIEAWHWSPLKSSPKLHEKIIKVVGMISDIGYYDTGRSEDFFSFHLVNMRLFVEHLTTLDVLAWDKMIAQADRSGPDMITAIAYFCSDEPVIRNEPISDAKRKEILEKYKI